MTSWCIVDVDTGVIVPLGGLVRFVDVDGIPDEARQLLDSGDALGVALVALEHGYSADIFTDTEGVEVSSVHPDAHVARVQSVRDGYASDFIVGWHADGLGFVCDRCSSRLPLDDEAGLLASEVEPGELCYGCGGLLAD